MNIHSLVRISAICLVTSLAPLVVMAQNSDDAQAGRSARWRQKLAGLSAPEREQLKTAHAKAMQDPGVRAAQAKLREAQKQYRETTRAAMLKADPNIQPVLDKIPEGHRRRNS